MLVVLNCDLGVPFLRGRGASEQAFPDFSVKLVLATADFSEPSPSLVAQRVCAAALTVRMKSWRWDLGSEC